MRHKGQQPYSVLTINGRLRLRRIRWHGAGASVTPTDTWLDEAEATVSEGVREMICRLNTASNSFASTASNLHRTACLEISKEQVRQLVEAEGKSVLREQARWELVPEWNATDCVTDSGATRVYLGCDGVKVPLVTEAEKQKRRAKIKQKRQRRGRRSKPLPRRRPGADQAYKEYRIVTLYDEEQTHRYVSVTRGDHEAVGRLLWRMAQQVELLRADERVANIDGAPWIRQEIELQGVASAIGLDFFHLRDNVQKTRRIVYGEESETGKQWLEEVIGRFATVGYDGAWEYLVEWRRPCRGAKRKEANRLLNYVSQRQEMIRYPEFREREWQISSGPTEAQCKSTTLRLKGRGRRWNPDNAEGIMALSCLQSSRNWHLHWKTLKAEQL